MRFASAYPELLDLRPVMRWETSLSDPNAPLTRWRQHFEWNYTAIVLMFWSIAVASTGLGVYRGTRGGLPVDDVFVWVLGGVMLLVSAVGVLLILRQLAIVCRTQGFLRFLAPKAIARQPAPEIPT